MTNLQLLQLCIWLCQEQEEPLNVLRQELLLRALEGERLKDIQINGFSSHYIRRVVAPNLWKLLSRSCGQKVTIHYLNLVLTKKYYELSPQEQKAIAEIMPQVVVVEQEIDGQKKNLNQTITTDHSEIPINQDKFYNQDQAIAQLTTLLKQNQQTLIFVLGNGGIGKTALVSQALGRDVELRAKTLWCNLSDRLNFQENFEFIQEQWELSPSTAVADPASECADMEKLVQHLQQHSKILVIDHWELLFTEEDFSGKYQPQHRIYADFLEKIARQTVKGTVIIISREVAPSMELLSNNLATVCTLTVPELSDKDAKKILKEYDLQDEHLWSEFVQTYRGNPLSIRLLCTSIKEWYGGSIAKFKQQNTVIGGDTLREILRELICRINPLEQEILYWLMLWGQPITLEELQLYYQREIPFTSQLWDVVRSLERRFLLEKSLLENPPLLTLQPSIQRYLLQEFTQGCGEEILQAIAAGYDPKEFNLLKHYQLALQLKTEAIATSTVIQAIIRYLQTRLRSSQQTEFHLLQLHQAAVQLTQEEYDYSLENLDVLIHYFKSKT